MDLGAGEKDSARSGSTALPASRLPLSMADAAAGDGDGDGAEERREKCNSSSRNSSRFTHQALSLLLVQRAQRLRFGVWRIGHDAARVGVGVEAQIRRRGHKRRRQGDAGRALLPAERGRTRR